MKTNIDLNQTYGEDMDGVIDPFSRDTTGLPDAITPQIVVLQPDDVLELRAEQVRKRIGEATVKMLADPRAHPEGGAGQRSDRAFYQRDGSGNHGALARPAPGEPF